MVSTTPYFITVGQDPFLQFNQPSSVLKNPVALAQNMVSTVKSGFFRVASGAVAGLWGGGEKEDVVEERRDPVMTLSVCHSVKDESKVGVDILVSPNKMYSAVKDGQNR